MTWLAHREEAQSRRATVAPSGYQAPPTTLPRPSGGDFSYRSSDDEQDRVGELLRQVAVGDANAFAALYDRLAPRAWAMARAVACDRDRAEVIAGQALAEVWSAAPTCPSDPQKAVAWTLGIVVPRSERAQTGGGRGSARAALDQRSRPAERVRQALLALPERQRDAILLSCYGRLPLADLAYVLGTTRLVAAAVLREALLRVGEPLRAGEPPSRAS